METAVILRPGRMPIADWRAIHGGAGISLDPVARLDVEAGHAALAMIEAGADAGVAEAPDRSASVADMIEARGPHIAEGEARLVVAMKLASLAQGTSGVRWDVLETMARAVAEDVLPVVPEGAGDRLALSQLFALLTGTGEALHAGDVSPAGEALRVAGLRTPTLTAHERTMLLSGNAPTLAAAFADLFLAEHIFQSALVAVALASAAGGQPAGFLHPVAHRLHRQRGQMEVAAALRALLPTSEAEPAAGGSNPNADRTAVMRMGAALDLMRQAGAILERSANGVTEDRLVLWQCGETTAGIEDTTSLALASELLAMAVTALGSLLAARAAAADEPTAARAASLAAENSAQGRTREFDGGQIRPARPLLRRLSEITALALLSASRDGASADGLDKVRTLISAAGNEVSGSDVDALAKAVGSGQIAASCGIILPLVGPPPAKAAAVS